MVSRPVIIHGSIKQLSKVEVVGGGGAEEGRAYEIQIHVLR